MTEEETTLKRIGQIIDQEGFWYCFDSYSDFSEVKDEKFHNLRRAFLSAGKELKDYVEGRTT